ncbi:DUF397 domain-containing protein [Streptomyces polygonati]|uniref:DUF397 domain-containing protein n=1 Tax=Streptomyces polygonati TaxID=1617087 RepID=A0ABV8HPB6_9ACTN
MGVKASPWTPRTRGLRERTKRGSGPALVIPAESFAAFVAAVREGRFAV